MFYRRYACQCNYIWSRLLLKNRWCLKFSELNFICLTFLSLCLLVLLQLINRVCSYQHYFLLFFMRQHTCLFCLRLDAKSENQLFAPFVLEFALSCNSPIFALLPLMELFIEPRNPKSPFLRFEKAF